MAAASAYNIPHFPDTLTDDEERLVLVLVLVHRIWLVAGERRRESTNLVPLSP